MNTDVSRDTKKIPHDLIDVDPEQPRRYFDSAAINELATSIKVNGLAVPILVRSVGERYALVHGERRFRAMTSIGWTQIPAEVRDLDPDAARWLQLVENVNREDLSPLEEAQAYRKALSSGVTQQQLADRIRKSRSQIAQKVRMLELPSAAQHLLAKGRLSEGHGRQLLRLKAFYNNSHTTTFDRTACRDIAALGAETDSDLYAPSVIRQIRPLDWPHAYPFKPEHRDDVDALREFLSELSDTPTVPHWHVTVTYYALAAAHFQVAVAALTSWLDNWIEQIESAIVCLATVDRLPDSLCHFGYKSDLRHAGLTSHNHISRHDLICRFPDWDPLAPSYYGCGPGQAKWRAHQVDLLKGEAEEDAWLSSLAVSNDDV